MVKYIPILKSYRLCQSLRLISHAENHSQNHMPIKIARNAETNIHSKAQLYLGEKAHFVFEEASGKKLCRPSLLDVGAGAMLRIEESFKVFDNSRIYVRNNARLIIGGGYISSDAVMVCTQQIEIGKRVFIADGVVIRDSDDHDILRDGYARTKPVRIGDHVWIGHGVTILRGVNIGDGAIIGAGAVVTGDIPAGCLAAGNPAKAVRQNVEWK